MLSTHQLKCHLNRVTYKPGWRFTVYDGEWEGQHIVITTQVPDAYGGEDLVIDVHSPLPPMPDFDYFNRWLMWRLKIIETHEMREFFRVSGQLVSDPHAEFAERDNPAYQPKILPLEMTG